VAKLEGLVGKVIEIDEKTRFRPDYVRMKIACRDVSKVPNKAQSALG
jgi:preprotein translocase subunit YajC